MRSMALADLLNSVLANWFSFAATWQPPGIASAGTCVRCAKSSFASILDSQHWPHSVMHPLEDALRATVGHVAIALREEDSALAAAELSPADYDHQAEALVLAALRRHAHEVQEVLDECVEPRVVAYLRSSLSRGLHELGERPDAAWVRDVRADN